MNTDTKRLDPGFDPRIADWLESDPDRAPGEVLDTILAALPSVPQRRALRVPWRFPILLTPIRAALVAALGVLLIGGAILTFRPGQSNVGSPSPSPSASPTPPVTPSPAHVDWSFLPGRLLIEHLGNAIDGSEYPTDQYNPDRRRLYFMDPKSMLGSTAVEFLPGQPTTGKSAADVSADGKKVVFQDWADHPQLYEANLDGTGFHRLDLTCAVGSGGSCQFLYPDYDPTATKVVYVTIQGDQSWLGILDLATGATTKLEKTVGPASDEVPEQPAWSPDGTSIAFTRLRWDGRNDPVVGTVRYGDQPPSSGKLSVVDVATGTVTDVPLRAVPVELPGDVQWSPDSQFLMYSSGPASTTGSDSGMPPDGGTRRVRPDGSGFEELPGGGGPAYLPDGQHIVLMNNFFYVMNADGTGLLPVNSKGMDLSDLPQGFAYIGHWVQPQ